MAGEGDRVISSWCGRWRRSSLPRPFQERFWALVARLAASSHRSATVYVSTHFSG